MGFDGEAEAGEGGTLVDAGGFSGEVDRVRAIPRLDRGRRVVRSGDDKATSLSPYKDVGLRLSAVVEDSGEFGTVV